MNSRTRSFSALESFDGNWVIGDSIPHQALYDIPKTSRQKRVPTGNTIHGKTRGHSSETWAEATKQSKAAAQQSYQKRDGHRGRNEFTTRRLKTNKPSRRSHSVEINSTSTSTTNSSGYISSRENFGRLVPREVVLHRSDGEFGFTMRQIPSTMYGRKPISAFRPTNKVPALQRLHCIDRGSLAERVGLKPGDYVLEVNNEVVTCSPHLYVVHLIKSSPNVLKLKVIEASEEDVFQPFYHSTLPQGRSTARNVENVRSLSTSSVPRFHDTELLHSQRSNVLPLQPLHTVTLAPHQNSNGPSSLEKRQPPTSRAPEPVVANIRLSRVAAHDQVFYESGLKQKTVKPGVELRTTTSDLQRIPSFASTVTVKSEPHKKDAKNYKIVKTTGSVQGELGIVHEHELPVTWGASSVDDANPTYDRVRPITVPFDTDEGYIRLSTNVDYVAQELKEQEQVDFLAMAEKARQMYLRTKSVSQTN